MLSSFKCNQFKKRTIMRKLKTLVLGLAILAAGTISANNFNNVDPVKKVSLAKQIGLLLKQNSFDMENSELKAQVLFTLNENREIVVLYVDTKNEDLAIFVKSKLNYKKVNVQEYKEGRTYTVPVRIVAE